MTDLSSKCALVFDHGLFLPLAHRLAESDGFGRVLYHSHWEDGFPTINKCVVGDGFKDIERCDDIWSVLDEVDCFVFSDILHSGLQKHLVSLGKNVWGSRDADSIELDREKFHRILAKTGLAVPEYRVITGLTALREHLKDAGECFLKVSRYRGSFETFHWHDWDTDGGMLDVWGVKFGPAGELIPFLVFDPLETDLEIGGDTYTVDGKWPSLMLRGDEWKDKGYLAAVTPRQDMPQPLQEVLDAFGPVLGKYECRNQWSMEVRMVDGKGYFIDPTPRGGLPSTGAQLRVWENFPQIIWAGSQGELLEPEPAAKFVAECALTQKGEKGAWGKIRVPEKLAPWMMLASCCEIDGAVCFPPDDSHGDEIGWLVALGDTIEETIETMLAQAKELPDGVSAKTDSLIDLLKEIASAEKQGIEFTEQTIPKPEIVVQAQP